METEIKKSPDKTKESLLPGLSTKSVKQMTMKKSDSKDFKKPPLGWISSLSCELGDKDLKLQVEALEKNGLKKIGFNTFILGCDWNQGIIESGKFKVDDEKFKGGMLAMGKYLKEKKMKFGLQIDSVGSECPAPPKHRKRGLIPIKSNSRVLYKRRYTTSKGRLRKRMFTKSEKEIKSSSSSDLTSVDTSKIRLQFQQIDEWGVEHLEYRPCLYISAKQIQTTDQAAALNKNYIEMGDAIKKSKNEIFFSTGQWGVPDTERNKIADSWKIVNPAFSNWQSFRQTVNALVPMANRSGPGKFNDLGPIEFEHPNMDPFEISTKIVFWAAAKSPLIISGDMTKKNSSIIKLLMNEELLGINQDRIGKSISFNRRYHDNKDIWSGDLYDGSKVAVVINWKPEERNLSLLLPDIGLDTAHGYDIITGEDLGQSNMSFSQTVGGHSFMFLKLNETKSCPERNWIEIPVNQKVDCRSMGTATLRKISNTVSAMTNLKSDYEGSVQWKNVDGGDKGGKILVGIDYINPFIDDLLPDAGCPNCRTILIKVNEKETKVELPISGFTPNDIFEKFLVELDGFEAGAGNKLTITGTNGNIAPDIVKVSFFTGVSPEEPTSQEPTTQELTKEVPTEEEPISEGPNAEGPPTEPTD
ncbi:hypothetical protein CROQUDRAFT_132271 [Cronartium quercuum f. sp. fusiforme G11]|uniref:Alpha-galactosidase n=1 Tax=Cronartium quercuum f. sp. fusiforme G11 TaxID=708437 RepID=A0A9P6TDL4_9BASI|nr:hypothetical protein CROQUDRAFT_132271 [Cronartium quercuum f. sp. fusiforme G11]